MASPFKIPKKKQPAGSESADLHMQSPLSRLQSSALPVVKGYQAHSSRSGVDRMHAGNALSSSTDRQRTSHHLPFVDAVKTLLGVNNTIRGGATAANHRPPGSCRSELGQRSESSPACLSDRWRPKRASDRLLPPESPSDGRSPPKKKKSAAQSGAVSIISVNSVDSLAELRAAEHAGSLTSAARDGAEQRNHTGSPPESRLKPQKKNPFVFGSDQTSEDDFVSPPRTRARLPALHSPSLSSSSVTTVKATSMPSRRRSLDRAPQPAASDLLKDDVREKERERWREFRERKTRLLRRPKQTEPIVLSSEEEGEDEERSTSGTSSSSVEEASKGNSGKVQVPAQVLSPQTAPSFLQLEFTTMHAGLTHADANGMLMITEHGITAPLKGLEDGEVTLVASQLCGYGVWDGGVARGGALLAGWEGPAPSLLFLWVTEAQANLLQVELSAIQPGTASGRSCCFLLLVLKEQLQPLQAALLASILDMDEYKHGRSSSPRGPASPLDWADGLLLLHSCPAPLDQHLLGLLGHSAKSGQPRTRSALQQLPSRLIQYPSAPCKGRITVTKEDLACLKDGEFLNDVIIDFYLKYLLLEGVGGPVAQRSHVFSSFFYKQLSRRRAAGEDDAPSVPDRHTRHQRVKTWTRNIDIFTKDFLFVPVNQDAHWFLVVVCFPGLEELQYEEFQRRAEGSERAAGRTSFGLRAQQTPESTEQGCRKDTVLKRPCILVMDSLKLSYHENVCRLLRDYLQVEWEVRRRTPRLFTSDSMRSSNCRVPQQDNSSDCGLYLLQYVESFLQNPVVHFDLPLQLDSWFPRQRVRQKREEIRSLVMRLHRSQQSGGEPPQ
ncbi:sentrin-specific protease 7-like isoform X1 [Parambassis ranga]|uniref:Sentrin-specific protease 7-like isoform X1 n=1 Tax=Parambassis ranga TaxID=210632 RepID=A0A6P7HY79_9TELE|nr:sentrin-specific protease 7-like isoform X1 [Parambassis ranga]